LNILLVSYALTVWFSLFVAQLFLLEIFPTHGAGGLSLELGLLFFLASFPRIFAPENRPIAYIARAMFVLFAGVLGSEVIVPAVHRLGPPMLFLPLFTIPTWMYKGYQSTLGSSESF
jgi:hypothetical protein